MGTLSLPVQVVERMFSALRESSKQIHAEEVIPTYLVETILQFAFHLHEAERMGLLCPAVVLCRGLKWPSPEREAFKSYPPRNAYAGQIMTKQKIMLNAEGSNDGWEKTYTKHGVTVRRQKVPGFEKRGTANEMFKGTGIINAPAFALFHMLSDAQVKHEFVEHVETINLLEDVDNDTRVVHEIYKTPTRWVSQREFVFLTHKCRVPDGRYVLVSCSLNSDSWGIATPSTKKYVRGEIITGGFVIGPDPGGDPMKCKATYIIHQDMNGSLPGFICSMIAKEVPMTVWDISQWVDKQNIDFATYNCRKFHQHPEDSPTDI